MSQKVRAWGRQMTISESESDAILQEVLAVRTLARLQPSSARNGSLLVMASGSLVL